MPHATGPYGSAPYGAGGGLSGVGYSPTTVVVENIVFHDSPDGGYSELLEVVQLQGVSSSQLINVLIDRLNLTGTVLPSLDFFGKLTDSVRYDTAMQLGWLIAVNEGVTLAGAAAGQRTTLAVIADTLHALGAVNTTLDAHAIISTVIALSTMMATGWKLELADTVEFEEALTAQLTAVTKLVDSIGLEDTTTPSLRLLALASDDLGLGDAPLPTVEMFEHLSEQVMFYTVIRLGDVEYTGWALNDGAPTEYRNYPFNGFLEFNGRYFGTSDTGLYEIGGTTDDGDPIEWSIKTALMDFATGKLKRVPDFYFSIAAGGVVYLKAITAQQDGKRHEDIYKATLRPGTGDSFQNDRIKIGLGLDARYWQFEFSGSGPMEFDEIAWRPLILDRRL